MQGLRRGRSLEWGFLLGLAAPMFVYHIVLRTIRVVQRGHMTEVLRWVDVYKSDLLVHGAFTLVGLGLLVAVRGHKIRPLVLVLLQLVAAVMTSIELVAFRFFMATGSTVDFQLIWFSLSQLPDTFDVVSSEVPTHIWVMLGISVVLAAALPWGATAAWSRWFDRGQASSTPRPRLAVGLVAGGAVVLGLAFAPPIEERSKAFARNAFLNVAATAVSYADLEATTARVATDTTDARLQPRPNRGRDLNVVLIILESTRARSVTFHNPELKTTPHLARLAESSFVAERAHTVVPHTSKALVATICGIEPRLHMPITEAIPDGIPGKCLAELLAEQGYETGFFQSATQRFEDRRGLVENMGYEDFYPLERLQRRGFEKANYFGREDDVMLEPSAKWLDQVEEPFFLTYLTLTPHHDYLAPDRYGRHDFAEDDELNRYLNAVHYVDAFTNNVIELFREKGLYDDTIFVILGDHGEGFDEHGRSQHDNVIWQEGLHVPFMIHHPERWRDGERFEPLVSQLDVVPTIADLLGFELVDATFPGQSLLRLDEDRVLRAHCWYERRCMASIDGHEKFIHHFEQEPDEFFDLDSDPLEENDIAESIPGLERRRSDLITWRASVNALYRRHTRGRLKEFVTEAPPVVEHPIEDVRFGDWVRLIGVEYPQEPQRPGRDTTVHFVFEVLEEFPPGWKMFTHGDSPGGRMKNLDHSPVEGLYPIEDWEAGDFVADEFQFRIPRSARDEYVLWMGFYHPDEGRAEVIGDIETDGNNRAKAIVLDLENSTPRKLRPRKRRQPSSNDDPKEK